MYITWPNLSKMDSSLCESILLLEPETCKLFPGLVPLRSLLKLG